MAAATLGKTGTLTAGEGSAAGSEGCPRLYLVLEYRRPAAGGAAWSLDGIDEVRVGRGETRRASRLREGTQSVLAIEVPDGRMSARHARIVRLAAGWAFEDLGSKNGSRIAGVGAKRGLLHDEDVLELGETAFLFGTEPASPSSEVAPPPEVSGLATLYPELAREHGRLAAVARSDVPVLLIGESGTGKELAARAVHALSGRPGRFVAVNCGALPSSLLEAELFGHRRGAFSGAVEARPGLVRSADRGTLFLDEVGDLAHESQAALLRVLQEKEVTPVGETEPVRVDVRFVSATHHDLEALCARERFRSDLLARLDGYTARLPPLRARRADLGVIVASLLERVAAARAPSIALHADAARALLAWDWPRNVREIEQALGAAVALAEGGVVRLEHLPERLRAAPRSGAPESVPRPPPSELSPDDAALRERLVSLFQEHRGSVSAVARVLGKDRTQIRRWMTRFRIEPEQWR